MIGSLCAPDKVRSMTSAPTATPGDTLPESLVVQDGAVLTITVSTAAAGNSLNGTALKEGAAALREVVRGEREVGAILLYGTGANFCAGGNVRNFASAQSRPAYLQQLADDFHAFVLALRDANRPVVAAVSKWAAGAGMSLVLHADVAIAGPSTKLRPAYGGIGLSPDGGMTWTLPRLVGAARARNIILTDKVISAEEGVEFGILSEIVDDDSVTDTARATARRLADGPRTSLAATRALLSRSADVSLSDQLIAEGRSIARLSGLADGIEGVDAFIGKRKPVYNG